MELLGFFVISMAIITVFLVDFFEINQFLASIVIYWNSVSVLNQSTENQHFYSPVVS